MKKIKWGVIGTAKIAEVCTIPGMKQAENCEMYAVAGRSIEKAEAFKEKYGFEVAYGSYDELLQDENVEAVYIALPNMLHYEWAKKALKAGKHVLCEKPLTPTAKEAEELYACAKENGVHLMEAFAYLHSPFIAAIKEEIDSGAIGEVGYIESAFMTGSYDGENIRMRRDTLGGCLYDLGCYNTSQILWLVGEEPDSVKAVADFSDQNIDVYTTALLSYKSGLRAVVTCGMMLEKRRIDRINVFGSKGYIKSEAAFNGEGELSYTIMSGGVEKVKTVNCLHNYRLEVEQLGRCITDGETPWVSGEFTVKNARIMDRILKEINY